MFAAEHSVDGRRGGPWSPFDAVAVVASQGGLAAFKTMLARLPSDFPAALVYVQHRAASARSRLVDLLAYSTELAVLPAIPGQPLRPATLYVAPPDAQLLVTEQRRFALRPLRSLGDPLLASMAAAYGPRVVGVVLSGRLDDGAAGARSIKAGGGRVLIQDPDSAECPSMPLNAMSTGCFDFVLEPERVAEALIALVTVPGAADLLGVRTHPWSTGSAVQRFHR